MSNKKLTLDEIKELKAFVKKKSKEMREGSTTAGAPGYMTPAAFTGDSDDDGTQAIDTTDAQFAYSIKAPKERKNSIKLHEISYKNFKADTSESEVRKINKKILEVNKMLGEISRSLDHSIKLKTESSLDNSRYWKRTNEAILKMNERLGSVQKKVRSLANLKELAAAQVETKLLQAFGKAGIRLTPNDIDFNQVGTEHYEFDVMIDGEPHGIDYKNGELLYQGYEKETRLGNINQEQELVKNISQTFKP